MWIEIQEDGVQQPNEPGKGGVAVTLYNGAGTALATQTTDTEGYYLFSGLTAGTYSVGFARPDGYVFTLRDAGGDDAKDSDVDPATGRAVATVLANGETDLTWDAGLLCYCPYKAAIGDYVWLDADGDGVQDTNETGVAGVAVTLYDGAGVALRTTNTSAAGAYLFSGLVPGTYSVGFALPSGYAFTAQDQGGNDAKDSDANPATGRAANTVLSPGETDLTWDAGLIQPTAKLGDYVWSDTDFDGVQDTNEAGVAGVLVTLYNQAGVAITSRLTDASGYYLFDGLVPGVYSVGFALPAGYAFTTRDAGGDDARDSDADPATGRTIPTTLSPGETDLTWDAGLVRPAAIGDYVWEDYDADGIQEAGEPGIPGVLVTLYDSGGTALATTNTGSGGSYLFSGLVPGVYSVGFTAPTGYVFTAADRGANDALDSDANPATGRAIATTLVAGETDLTWDAGLYRPASVGDFVWLDLDEDGIQDTCESPEENTFVVLYDANFNIVATALTGCEGKYHFGGLKPGTYYVGFTPDPATVFQFTKQNVPPDDALDSDPDPVTHVTGPFVLVSGQHDPTRDAGVVEMPTSVQVGAFRAYAEGGRAVVEWKTVMENGSSGFLLLREKSKASYEQVNAETVPSLMHAAQGATYRVYDNGAKPGATCTYKLVEIEAGGRRNVMGPYTVTVAAPAPAASTAGKETDAAAPGRQTLARAGSFSVQTSALQPPPKPAAAARARKVAGKEAGPVASRIKIGVTAKGVYYVPATQIASILGLPLANVQTLLQTGGLKLSTRGQDVSYLVAGGNAGLYFYGEAYSDVYTDTNVYWLEPGAGTLMAVQAGAGPAANPGGTFRDTATAERDVYALPVLYKDPESDYWAWDFILGGFPPYDRKPFPVATPGAAGAGSATVTASLKGASAAHHPTEVYLNGTLLGSDNWTGTETRVAAFAAPGSYVLNGTNTVEVKNLAVTGSVLNLTYADAFAIEYDRVFAAGANRLWLRGDGRPVVTVTGFSDAAIVALDLTDPKHPVLRQDVTVENTGVGQYRLSFAPASAATPYVALGAGAVAAPASVDGVAASTLATDLTGAQYVIVVSAPHRATVQRLATYRQSRGLSVLVADVAEIYNEFGHGFYTPHAIRAFLKHAYDHWTTPPSYAVLIGDGTYDYKNLTGFCQNYVPTVLAATPYGLFAADNVLADATGDDVPDIAIGRLPACPTQELDQVITKIIDYEAQPAGTWAQSVVMVADNPDSGGKFDLDADRLTPYIGAPYNVQKVYLRFLGAAAARQQTLDALNAGSLLLAYIGHAGLTQLAEENLLTNGDVPGLTNGTRAAVFAGLSCVLARHELPGADPLGEALLHAPNGGAIATWAPSGLSLNSLGRRLGEGFFEAVFADGEKVLGDAIWMAIDRYTGRCKPKFVLKTYTLLGDPALQMK